MSDQSPTAAYFQGIGVGLAGGYFAGWWLEGTLMFIVAILGMAFVTLGYLIDKQWISVGITRGDSE